MNLIKNFDLGSWFDKDDLFSGFRQENPYANTFTDPLWDKQWYMVSFVIYI